MNHIVFFVEDISGKKMLEGLLPKLIPSNISYQIYSYKGVGGKIPKDRTTNPKIIKSRILLANLPRLLSGCGNTFDGYGNDYRAAVIVVCDLDDRDKNEFLSQLNDLLNACDKRPDTRFCLAVEEGEAWLLGDLQAVQTAYPSCNMQVLNKYVNDTICGTWEFMANALSKGGATQLKEGGIVSIGSEKIQWAERIVPYMNIDNNKSPSFCYFRDSVRTLIS